MLLRVNTTLLFTVTSSTNRPGARAKKIINVRLLFTIARVQTDHFGLLSMCCQGIIYTDKSNGSAVRLQAIESTVIVYKQTTGL